jgi:hypothetical protein
MGEAVHYCSVLLLNRVIGQREGLETEAVRFFIDRLKRGERLEGVRDLEEELPSLTQIDDGRSMGEADGVLRVCKKVTILF